MTNQLIHRGLFLTAVAVALPGCQGSSVPPTVAISDEPQATSESAPKSQSAAVTKTPKQTAENELPSLTPGTAAAPAKPVANPEAEAAFEKLQRNDLAIEEWEQATQKLIALGPVAFPALRAGLGSTDSFVRENAAMVLAQMVDFDASTKQALKAALVDESAFVRANAAAALSQSPEHASDIIPVLAELLETGDGNLKKMAASNLTAIGEEAAQYVTQLTTALQDEDADVVLPVVQLLGRIGPRAEAAVTALNQIARERTGELRSAAVHAIELIAMTADETTN